MLSIKLKNSKTSKSGEIVDVYENDSAICPVKAYSKLSKITKAMAKNEGLLLIFLFNGSRVNMTIR